MDLRYGLHWDRDYLMDITSRVQSILPIVSFFTIYPVNFYLLLVEGPNMIGDIRAAYLAYFISQVLLDLCYSFLMRMYALPPYGLFYCDGILCTSGLSKPVVMMILAIVTILPITTFVFLMMRMHQLVISESNSRWKLSLTSQLAFMLLLTVMLIVNVFGFVIYTTDVPNYVELVKTPEFAWLEKRGGTILLFGEPGKRSEFLKEMVLFAASFSFFLPPVIFFIENAITILKRSSQNAASTKTQQLTRKLFIVFQLQLLSAVIFFLFPFIFPVAAGVIDMRNLIPDGLFAFTRFINVIMFTLNPFTAQLIFLLRNETHRETLRRRISRIRICGADIFGVCIKDQIVPKQTTVTDMSIVVR